MCRRRRTPYIHHPPRATREGDEKENKQTTEKLTGRAKREQAGERALLHLRNWYLQLCRTVCACACIYICMSFTLLLPLNTARAGVYDLTAYLPGYGKRLLCFSIPGFCSSILCLRVGVGVLLVCICCFLSVIAGASSVLLFLPLFSACSHLQLYVSQLFSSATAQDALHLSVFSLFSVAQCVCVIFCRPLCGVSYECAIVSTVGLSHPAFLLCLLSGKR